MSEDKKEKELKFLYKKVSDLIPYVNNARTHNEENVIKLASSIKEFGFMAPIIISEDGGVIAGHGRLMAAKKLGLEKVPCVVESHLSDIQRKGYILADNRLALDSGWDDELLKMEMQTLNDVGFDMKLTGFDEDEINNLLKVSDSIIDNQEEEHEIEINEEIEPITKPGDVWLMGDHRLICGDSTDEETVKKLFGNDKPNLMVTDPPYGVNYNPYKFPEYKRGKNRLGKVLNDDRSDWKDAYKFFPGDIAYVWHSSSNANTVHDNLCSLGFEQISEIIWNKDNFVLGRSDYHQKHEPCFYMTRGPHNWQGGRNKSSVWDIPRINSFSSDERNDKFGHSTQKPIECMKRPIENNSLPGEFVYDPFCGSGTTVIAAERTKRKCLCVELSPVYCDVIVKRWESETGRKATRQSDGVAFDALANK